MAFRIRIAIPRTNDYPYYDQCHRKDLNFPEMLKNGKDPRSFEFQTNKTVGCTRWEYNFTQIPYPSIGTEVKYLPSVFLRLCHSSRVERFTLFAFDSENDKYYRIIGTLYFPL